MSNIRFAARVTNYAEAATFLDGAWSRKIGYATVVKRSITNPRIISLIHHDTAIITWCDGDNAARIDTDGYVSRTTANRLNYFTAPRYFVGSRITPAESHYTFLDTDTDEVCQYDGYGTLMLVAGE